jgi:hypothetical protein
MSSKTVAVVEQESFSNFPAFHATMSDQLIYEEQAEAVELAKRMFEDAFTRDHYRRPNKQLIEIGLRLKADLPPPAYPNPLLPYWRDKRYKGKVECVNLGSFLGPIPPGLSDDGWPAPDKADEEARLILAAEWKTWLSYCRHFADRFGEGVPPSGQEQRIVQLERENARLQAALDEATAKSEKARQAFASIFA